MVSAPAAHAVVVIVPEIVSLAAVFSQPVLARFATAGLGTLRFGAKAMAFSEAGIDSERQAAMSAAPGMISVTVNFHHRNPALDLLGRSRASGSAGGSDDPTAAGKLALRSAFIAAIQRRGGFVNRRVGIDVRCCDPASAKPGLVSVQMNTCQVERPTGRLVLTWQKAGN